MPVFNIFDLFNQPMNEVFIGHLDPLCTKETENIHTSKIDIKTKTISASLKACYGSTM